MRGKRGWWSRILFPDFRPPHSVDSPVFKTSNKMDVLFGITGERSEAPIRRDSPAVYNIRPAASLFSFTNLNLV